MDKANAREAYWIQELNSLVPTGYNLKEGGAAGGPDSPETRQKKSQSKLGKCNSFYGKKHSEESKLQISSAKMGQSLAISEDDRNRRRNQMIKMNKERIGRELPLAVRKRIAASQIGKTHSEETKRKMSEARRKWWAERNQACKINQSGV